MGKLIQKLNRVGSTSAPRLGFGMGTDAKRSGMLLIATIESRDEATAKAAVSGGADAVLVSEPSAKKTKTSLAKSLGVADNVATGGYASTAADGEAAGWDFVVLLPGDPVGPLVDAESLDRVLRLPREVPDATLRALEALPVDSIVLEIPESALLLEDLISICRVTQATRKPVLALVPIDIDRSTLIPLRDAGVVGLIATVTKSNVKGLKTLHQMILDLPAKKARGSKSLSAPALGLAVHAAGANDDQYEEEPYEDDEE